MTQDEAENLARHILTIMQRDYNAINLACWDEVNRLCDHILSGAMKREIENAAIAMVADEYSNSFGDEAVTVFIRALIQPPAQKENGR